MYENQYVLLIENEDETHELQIISSDYNIYEKDGKKWITFHCEAENSDTESWVEINIPYQPDEFPTIDVGTILTGIAYDAEKKDYLTNIYFYVHENFENPHIEILDKNGDNLNARISNNSGASGSITVLADFSFNPERSKSFG